MWNYFYMWLLWIKKLRIPNHKECVHVYKRSCIRYKIQSGFCASATRDSCAFFHNPSFIYFFLIFKITDLMQSLNFYDNSLTAHRRYQYFVKGDKEAYFENEHIYSKAKYTWDYIIRMSELWPCYFHGLCCKVLPARTRTNIVLLF